MLRLRGRQMNMTFDFIQLFLHHHLMQEQLRELKIMAGRRTRRRN